MKNIFVCSPFRAGNGRTEEENIENAKMCCLLVAMFGHNPFAPHLFYTRFLDDSNPVQRDLGIKLGTYKLLDSDAVWVFAKNFEDCTEGMKHEITFATAYHIPVKFFDPETIQAGL